MVGLKLRMAIALYLLFGLLFAFFMGVTYFFYYMGYLPDLAIIFIPVVLAIVVILLQWGISPYILKWVYKIDWVGDDAPSLEPRVARVYERVRTLATEQGVKMPRFGIVPDDNPNAFTFGWTRNSSFLVLTRGIFKYCDDEEAEAVAAHEVGHVVHNDFVVMTVVAAVVLLFYVIFRGAIMISRSSGRSRDSGKAAAAALAVAVVSYIVYILANFIALLVSRYREYWADEYSAEAQHNPNALSSALVKIAYGLATEGRGMEDSDRSRIESRHSTSLGIFNVNVARALAAQPATADGAVSKEAIKQTMAWDLWNPWAFFYELGMTHPLPAKRITVLGNKAKEAGMEPFIEFDLVKPESYWDDFLKDVFMLYSWLLCLPVGLATWWLLELQGAADTFSIFMGLGSGLAAAGLFGFLYLFFYKYPRGFRDAKVVDLLKDPKASPVRGIPVRLRGHIIGRGVPGLFFSEDFKMDDGTGLLLIDYRSIARVIDLLQGIFATQRFVGTEVEAVGWYRRAVLPMLDLRAMYAQGPAGTTPVISRRVYRMYAEMAFALIVLALGAIVMALALVA